MKKVFRFGWRVLLALAIVFANPGAAAAANPDRTVSGASYYVTLASSLPWNQLSANYIFTPESPNVGICLFIENQNPTSSHSLTVTAFQTGNPSLSGYAGQTAYWAADQVQGAPASIPAGSVKAAYIETTGAAQVAILVANTTTASGTPDTANIFAVQTAAANCGPAGVQTVQGALPTGANPSSINPVLVGGAVNGGVIENLQLGVAGGTGYGVVLAYGSGSGPYPAGAAPTYAPDLSSADAYYAAPLLYAGAPNTAAYEMRQSIRKFHDTSATAAGNTAVWTPPASAKFNIMCVGLEVTGDAKAATAGDLVIQLEDASTPIAGMKWQVYIPTTAFSQSEDFVEPMACFANGYLSTTANNVLNVNLSFALTAGAVEIRVWGLD